MKISIVTVNRNNAAGLAQTLDSVKAQSFHDVEHIVIDGGSTDGSVDVIRAHADRLAHWVSEPDGGIYPAMNKGWRAARGEYVNFLNSGDRLAGPDTLARVFSGPPWKEDALYGNPLQPDGRGRVREIPQAEDPTPALFFVHWGICHQAMFYRREMLAALGGYDEGLQVLGDWDFAVRALLAGHSFRHLPFPVAFYDTGGISATQPGKLAQEREWIMRRHLPPAVCRDYEQMNRIKFDYARLRGIEHWYEQARRRSFFINSAMIVKWSWDRWRGAIPRKEPPA